MIALHTFGLDGRCACGKQFADIAFAAYDPCWLGKTGISHSGELTLHEQSQIRDEVERIYAMATEGARA